MGRRDLRSGLIKDRRVATWRSRGRVLRGEQNVQRSCAGTEPGTLNSKKVSVPKTD